MPPTLEERVAYLEGKVEEQSRLGSEIREMITHLDQRLSSRIDSLDQKVDRIREELSGRIDSLDQRLSSRIDSLDQKFSRYFLWIIGIQVTIFLAIIATFLR